MVTKTVICHYYPIEGYPPVQNLLNIIGSYPNALTFCMTTHGQNNHEYTNESIKIIRLGTSASKSKFKNLSRYISYIAFNLGTFFYLLRHRPSNVLYYETISAFPVLLFKYLCPKTKLFILYHEYTSKKEYADGPALVRLIHKFEIKFYERACWISHTNKDRLRLFCDDYHITTDKIHCLPNYPPSWWLTKPKGIVQADKVLKFVYVGYTLDNHSMYVEEFVNIIRQNPSYTLDLYLLKTPENLKNSLASEDFNNRIQFKKGLAYNELPVKLKHYDVGVILYRGLTKNYIYNAPNKLFEYLACGLSVWYPKVMVGIRTYKSNRVIALDYESSDFSILKVKDANGRGHINYDNFTAEKAFEPLLKNMIS